MSDLYFGNDLFSEFDRLQRRIDELFGGFPSSIRSGRFGAFPQVNIGTTDDAIEIVAFAPGINPAGLDVSGDRGLLIDRGLLTISCEREAVWPDLTSTPTKTPAKTSAPMRRSASPAHSGG